MISFPLYDTLISNIQLSPDKEENVDKTKLIKWVNTFDQDGFNKIYALIRYYSLNDPTQQKDCIPFQGQILENEFIFDLDKIPHLLQQILFHFAKLHLQHMKYIQKIEKFRKKSNDNK